jgi:hypothetical protein
VRPFSQPVLRWQTLLRPAQRAQKLLLASERRVLPPETATLRELW